MGRDTELGLQYSTPYDTAELVFVAFTNPAVIFGTGGME